MALIIVLSFLGAFIIIALPLIAVASGTTKRSKQVMTALDAALGDARQNKGEGIPDFRKGDQLSSIPWLNQWLLNLHLMQRLQDLLDQADLHWTAGKMLAACGLCVLVPAYVV